MRSYLAGGVVFFLGVQSALAGSFDLPADCDGVATIVYEDCVIVHAAGCSASPGRKVFFQIRDGALSSVVTRWDGVLAEEVLDAFGREIVRFSMDYEGAVAQLQASRPGDLMEWRFQRYAPALAEDGVLGEQTFERLPDRILALETGEERVRVYRVEASIAAAGERTLAERYYSDDLGLELGREVVVDRAGFPQRSIDRPVSIYRPGEPGYLENEALICGATT
ncbi:MAG: hypothetical protein AAF661_16295 [Pseudomonadota bacterium]